MKHTLVIITKQRVSVAITIMTRIIYVCGIQKIIYEKQRKYSITTKKTLHALRITLMIFYFLHFCHFRCRISILSTFSFIVAIDINTIPFTRILTVVR